MRDVSLGTILISCLLSILCTMPGCSHAPSSSSADKTHDRTFSDSRVFASISDLHFNPFYDPTLVDNLIQSDYTEWKAIFSTSKIKSYGTYGHDTNYPLLDSALKHAARVAKDADFVIISGDFLSHRFNKDFYTYSGNKEPKALHEFINKTIAFITMMLTESFSTGPVYPVVGNDDSYCGDYRIQPDGEFLKATSEIWKGFFRSEDNTKAFLETFPVGGNYTILPMDNSAHRLIALNTIFWSIKYQNACGNSESAPGQKQIQWLDFQLKQASTQKQKVWLVFHIPPGVNPYVTSKANSTGALTEIISYWDAEYTNRFMELMAKYSSVIALSFVGHVHMDNFELVREQGTGHPISFVHFTPSISPIFGNNPGFQLIAYDPNSYTLVDYETHYMNLSVSADLVKWKREYRFSTAYDQSLISTKSLQSIYQRMEKNLGNDRKNYIRYYNLNNTASPVITEKNWPFFWCSIGNITQSQFSSCYESFSNRSPKYSE